MARVTYYVPMGGWNYAWDAEEDKYKNIAAGLGIKKADDNTKDLVFGAQRPKPPRVRLNFEKPRTGKPPGAQLVFIKPSELQKVVNDGAINGKTSNGKKIVRVGLC